MTQQDFGRPEAGTGSVPRQADAMTDETRREAGTIAQEARGAARDVADEARRVGQRAKSEAAGLVGTVRGQIAEQAEAQKDSVADRVASIAGHLHGSAGELRDREGWLADLIDRGARELDGFAEDLRQRDVKSLLGGVESFAHRHPAVFIGSAVAVGFALTRMLRGGTESEHGPGARSGRLAEAGRGGPVGGYPGAQRVEPTYPAAADPLPAGAATTTGAGAGYIDPGNQRPDLGLSPTSASGSRPTDLTGDKGRAGMGSGSGV